MVNPTNREWVCYSKGGDYRKWWGNNEYVLRYFGDGSLLKRQNNATLPNEDIYDKSRCTWSDISAGKPFAARLAPLYSFYDIKGHSFFPSAQGDGSLAFSNSNFFNLCINVLNPGLNFQVGDARRVPAPNRMIVSTSGEIERRCVDLSEQDWDSKEVSWGFEKPQIYEFLADSNDLRSIYHLLRKMWRQVVQEMKGLEEKNNEIYINYYELQNVLQPVISLEDVTLSCNPYYQYASNKTDTELESLLLADTIRELISYAVGCMFGRYSLDKPGLILANQGETINDYFEQNPSPTFSADEDNVIPILDGDWFADDIVERFRQFLRVTFREASFQNNLQFIEEALGKDIRSFFLKDFYSDHIKRYKKRPIYWLFSSPKGTFNALIYMHRYRTDTVSVVLNKYLREFKVKLSARMEYLNRIEVSANASKSEKTRAIKERETLKKNLDELDVWERDVLYPLALEQKEIDLDDGVKVNYPKFGAALKRIPGLDVEED